MPLNQSSSEGSPQATFIEGDEKKEFPLFPEDSGVTFGYGNWPDTAENRKIIKRILEEGTSLQAGIEERQAKTKIFIAQLLRRKPTHEGNL